MLKYINKIKLSFTLKKYNLSLLIVLLISVSSCKNFSADDSQDQKNKKVHTESFSKKVNLSGITTTNLSADASASVSEWTKFLIAKSEIQKIENLTLKNFLDDKDNLAELANRLSDSLPKKFDTIPIKSRLKVLKTKTQMFKQYAKRDRPKAEKVNDYAVEIYKAFADVEIQLNELFIRKMPDFEVDMDRKQDSILAAKKQIQKDTVKK